MKGPVNASLKDFLGVRKRGTGPGQTKAKGDKTRTAGGHLTTTLKTKNVTVANDSIAARLARAAARSKTTSTKVPAVASNATSYTMSPQKHTPVTTSLSPPRRPNSDLKRKSSSISDEEKDDSARRRLFDGSEATGSDKPVAVTVAAKSSMSSKYAHLLDDQPISAVPASGSRRRLFSAAAASESTDPIAKAVAAQKNKTRVSTKERFAHLLDYEPTPSSSEEPTSSNVEKKEQSGVRYRYLLNKASLALPLKYQVLLAKFLALETVMMIQQHVRGRTVTFDTARPMVERTCAKRFLMDDLARILTVYPNAYKLDVIRRNGMSPGGPKCTVDGYSNGKESVRISVDFGTAKEVDINMHARKEAFIASLKDITNMAHQRFLSELPTPVTCNGVDIKNWHPDFKLDEVPDIKKADMPDDRKEHVPSASEILKRKCAMSPTVKRALEHVVAKQSIPESPTKKRRVENNETPAPEAPFRRPTREEAQAKRQALLERIREKERLNKERKMRHEAEANGPSKAMKLREFALIVQGLGRSKGRNTVLFADCVLAVVRCIKVPMMESRIRELLQELPVAVPEWCQIKRVQNKTYFAMVPAKFGVAKQWFSDNM